MSAFYDDISAMTGGYEIAEVGPGPNMNYMDGGIPEAEWKGPMASWSLDCVKRHKVLYIGGFGQMEWGRIQLGVPGKKNAKKYLHHKTHWDGGVFRMWEYHHVHGGHSLLIRKIRPSPEIQLVMTKHGQYDTRVTAVAAEDGTTILEVIITADVNCREFKKAVLAKCVVLNLCTRQTALTMYHDSVLMTSNSLLMRDWGLNYRNRLPRIITAKCSGFLLVRYLKKHGIEAPRHPDDDIQTDMIDIFAYADVQFERLQAQREQNRSPRKLSENEIDNIQWENSIQFERDRIKRERGEKNDRSRGCKRCPLDAPPSYQCPHMMPPPREVPAKKRKTTVDDFMNTVPWGMHVGGRWQLAKAARDAQASVVVVDGVDDTPAVVLPIRPTAAPAPTDAGIAAGPQPFVFLQHVAKGVRPQVMIPPRGGHVRPLSEGSGILCDGVGGSKMVNAYLDGRRSAKSVNAYLKAYLEDGAELGD